MAQDIGHHVLILEGPSGLVITQRGHHIHTYLHPMPSTEQIVPQERGTPQETFDQLGQEFGISKVVTDFLITKRMAILQDFRFYFQDEGEIQALILRIADSGIDKAIETSRVRQAWKGRARPAKTPKATWSWIAIGVSSTTCSTSCATARSLWD